ncbi:MAG TPA: hypothetical protein DCX06_09715 [Opitutae bacterium]|nr:hypothetical protein [Opitutae bacterium]
MLTLATCCNARFFGACLTLINSAQRNASKSVQAIRVYDLGLKGWQRKMLKNLRLVEVVDFPKEITQLYPDFFNAKGFAWKQCIWIDLYKLPNRSLYLDSGIEILKDLSSTERLIQTDGILLVEDENWYTHQLTHQACLRAMDATEEEANKYMLCSGIVGIDPNGSYLPMFEAAFEYSKLKECLLGSSNEPTSKHRQDQSILSILSARYACPKQPLEIYAQWEWPKVDDKTILHVHRKRKGIRKPTPKANNKMSLTSWLTLAYYNFIRGKKNTQDYQ